MTHPATKDDNVSNEPLNYGTEERTGTTESLDDLPEYVACLWVPDPESRRGFREYYVKRQGKKPGARKMGL